MAQSPGFSLSLSLYLSLRLQPPHLVSMRLRIRLQGKAGRCHLIYQEHDSSLAVSLPLCPLPLPALLPLAPPCPHVAERCAVVQFAKLVGRRDDRHRIEIIESNGVT